LLLLRGVSRATQVAAENPGKSMTILYAGAAQRFLLVLALLGAGLALLKLHPLGVLLGFALAQVSTMLAGRSKPKTS
jgi:ATP synthase I chain